MAASDDPRRIYTYDLENILIHPFTGCAWAIPTQSVVFCGGVCIQIFAADFLRLASISGATVTSEEILRSAALGYDNLSSANVVVLKTNDGVRYASAMCTDASSFADHFFTRSELEAGCLKVFGAEFLFPWPLSMCRLYWTRLANERVAAGSTSPVVDFPPPSELSAHSIHSGVLLPEQIVGAKQVHPCFLSKPQRLFMCMVNVSPTARTFRTTTDCFRDDVEKKVVQRQAASLFRRRRSMQTALSVPPSPVLLPVSAPVRVHPSIADLVSPVEGGFDSSWLTEKTLSVVGDSYIQKMRTFRLNGETIAAAMATDAEAATEPGSPLAPLSSSWFEANVFKMFPEVKSKSSALRAAGQMEEEEENRERNLSKAACFSALPSEIQARIVLETVACAFLADGKTMKSILVNLRLTCRMFSDVSSAFVGFVARMNVERIEDILCGREENIVNSASYVQSFGLPIYAYRGMEMQTRPSPLAASLLKVPDFVCDWRDFVKLRMRESTRGTARHVAPRKMSPSSSAEMIQLMNAWKEIDPKVKVEAAAPRVENRSPQKWRKALDFAKTAELNVRQSACHISIAGSA